MSVYDRSQGVAVTPEGTVCQSRDNQWNGIRTTNGVIGKGKYYFEAKVSDEGLCRVGWAMNEVRLMTLKKIIDTLFHLTTLLFNKTWLKTFKILFLSSYLVLWSYRN